MKKVLLMTLAFVLLVTGVCSAGKSKLKKQTPTPAVKEEQVLLLEYYEIEETPEGQPYYEIVLYRYSDAEVLLAQYTEGGTPAEKVTTYRVPAEAYEKTLAIIKQFDMATWNSRDDCFPIDGKRYVCKFREGDRLIRATSDAMPENGEAVFSAVRGVLERYMEEKFKVLQ